MGRPKGAKNKRTKGIPPEINEQLGNRDPALVLAEVYAMPLDQLKRMIRSKAGAQAVALKIRAAEIAMPYKYSKMPIAVIVNEDKLPTLVIVKGAHQMQQIQQLMKDVTPQVGRGAKSDEANVTIEQEVKANEQGD